MIILFYITSCVVWTFVSLVRLCLRKKKKSVLETELARETVEC